MNHFQIFSDKMAISLSIICAIHCLLLPVLVIALPAIASFGIADEAFHKWMLVGIVPLSVLALSMGCKKHQHIGLFVPGIIGLSILIVAALFGHDAVGETGEKILTVIGAAIVAFTHACNHLLCRHNNCLCVQG